MKTVKPALSQIFLAAIFTNIGTAYAGTPCQNAQENLSALVKQEEQDRTALNGWCANSLSTACQQEGPGMRLTIQALSEEIAAARLQVATVCPPPPPPPPPLFIRRSIFTLDPNGAAVASLRKGFQVMQSRQPTDPLSLTYQAGIHGTYVSQAGVENQCQHGSYFFFPWHRMYLYYFERILRAAAGDPQLTIPYWNYWNDPNVADLEQRELPVVFRQPADSNANSLYTSQRVMNDGEAMPASGVNPSNALSFTNFDSPVGQGDTSFGGPTRSNHPNANDDFGALETTPHNAVHNYVGGPAGPQCSGGLMSDPNCSAQDPVFYVHHSNIDRLWKRWLAQGGQYQNPVNDSIWMNTKFTFYDVSLNAMGEQVAVQVQRSGQEILDTVAQLDYCYDDDIGCGGKAVPGGGAEPVPVVAVPHVIGKKVPVAVETVTREIGSTEAVVPPVELATSRLTVPIATKKDARREIEAALSPSSQARFRLALEGIEFDKTPELTYEIYLDLPEKREADYKDTYYVGNLVFFGLHRAGAEHVPSLHFDLTRTIRALRAAKVWKDNEVSVTFVARWLEDGTGRPLPIPPGVRAKVTSLRVLLTTPK